MKTLEEIKQEFADALRRNNRQNPKRTMKTLEEKAKEFRIKKLKEQGYRFDSYQVMADFARQCVHQALDEAAEKAEGKMKPFDVKSVCKIITDSILSLKEKY